jgi:hypothetical protein
VSVRSIVTGANKRTSFLRLVDEPKAKTNQEQRIEDDQAYAPEPYDLWHESEDYQ